MPIHQQTVKLTTSRQLFSTLKRCLFTQSSQCIAATSTVEAITDEWTEAKPFADIPGPSKVKLLRGFLPGGNYFNKSLVQLNAQLRQDFGEIFVVPGLFGKRDVLFTFNPADYQRIFRTEGAQPMRRGLDIVVYYRKMHRPEIFKHAAGLVSEQGESWAHFRSTVNPVMMNPKTVKLYAPKANKVVDEFMALIRRKRNPRTLEMPIDFESDINNWAMDSVCLVALDTELGMINNSANNPKAKAVIHDMREFFELLFQLDLQPSLWKIVATPKFKRIIQKLDEVTEMTIYYIDQAIERLQSEVASGKNKKPEAEQSVLERLLSIDRTVAMVMAMDMLLAGVDTTTSAFTACLLCLAKHPEKQHLLRKELRGILPTKCSAITSDQLKNLPYLRACIKEALRTYPVSTSNFRTTGQDVVLSGYRVPKGVDVAMPGQQLLHDERYYARPLEYLPERWLRGAAALDAVTGCPLNHNVPFVFLPFGFGPRICIGKRFVDLELEVALAKLVRNFEIGYDYSVENMFKTNIINVPGKPLQFKFIEVEN